MVCKHIVVHHSAGIDSEADNWKSIRKYHMTHPSRMYRDIGYHAGIEIENGVFRIRYGRKLTEDGAHCPGMNRTAAGFCFVGDFTHQPPPLQMLQKACTDWFWPTMRAHGMGIEDIFMHHEKRATQCPGDAFPKDLLLYVLDSVK